MKESRDMDPRRAAIESLVAHLCSHECAGRQPGTPESAAARHRIVAELEEAGVAPAGDGGYEQKVPGCGVNVLARLHGAGDLADRAVVVAAHYDHLGRIGQDDAYWGADDNAAAVAILADVARALSPPRGSARQVILAFFDGEEPPHFMEETMGSMYYTKHPSAPLASTDMMVCLDLLGHALGQEGLPTEIRQTLFVLGAELSEKTPELVDEIARRACGVFPRRIGLDVIPPLSDYYAFVEERVPVLFLTCGRWEHYHSPTDTPDKLDYSKIVATADFVKDLVETLTRVPEAPVAFRPDGRDDEAQVATLRAMAELLEPHVANVDAIRPVLDSLAEAAARGPLDAAQRERFRALAMSFEEELAGPR